jgi:hypothetical protein
MKLFLLFLISLTTPFASRAQMGPKPITYLNDLLTSSQEKTGFRINYLAGGPMKLFFTVSEMAVARFSFS